ncbi:MAG: TolC family protein [Sphingorhabdus sp.]|jgi:outer membrane protein|nr:TolC family protein [Sphingorhabdus sp.]
MQSKLRFQVGFSSIALVLAVASPVPTPAGAQPAQTYASPHGTMESLARDVVGTHPEIEAQRQQIRIAKSRMQAAESGYLPTVVANGIVQKREIDVKSGGNGDARFIAAQASVEARVRFYDGDRTHNAIQVAKAELESAEAAMEAKVSDILLELLSAAADVHLNRKVKQFSELQSEAIGEQLRATSRRLEFGESTRTDENLAKARLATSQAGILAVTEQLNVDGYRFRAVSGQSGTIVPPLPQLAQMPGSLAEAQSTALEQSPRLQAARLNAQAAAKGVNLAAGALLPQVDAVGGYEYLTGGVANLFTGKLPDDRSALYGGIEVRVPVFQPRDFAEIRRARAVRDQRLAMTDFGARTVAQEVASSWTRWQSAKSTIVTAQEAVVAIEKAAEGIRKESVEGNRTLSDVLNAQNELLAARITLERAARNEFVARAGLLASIGKLDVEAILAGASSSATSATDRPTVSGLGVRIAPTPIIAQASPGPADRPVSSALGVVRADSSPEIGYAPIHPDTRPPTSALGRKAE